MRIILLYCPCWNEHVVHPLQVEIGELKGRLTEVISNCDAICKRIAAEGPECLRSSIKPFAVAVPSSDGSPKNSTVQQPNQNSETKLDWQFLHLLSVHFDHIYWSLHWFGKCVFGVEPFKVRNILMLILILQVCSPQPCPDSFSCIHIGGGLNNDQLYNTCKHHVRANWCNDHNH